MSKAPKAEAPKKQYNKSRSEHAKDLLIAMLITGIITFIGGMQFQAKQQGAIEAAVRAVTPVAEAQAEVKK